MNYQNVYFNNNIEKDSVIIDDKKNKEYIDKINK